MACEGDPAYDELILVDDGRVLRVLTRLTATGSEGAVFEEDDGDQEMEFICCRLIS